MLSWSRSRVDYNSKVDAINSDLWLLLIHWKSSPYGNYDPSDTNTVWLHCWNLRWKAAKVAWGETYPCQCWLDWVMKFPGLLHIHCFFESITLYRWKVTLIQCGMSVIDCIDALQSWPANQRIWIYKVPNRGRNWRSKLSYSCYRKDRRQNVLSCFLTRRGVLNEL